ncbi:MAG: hypothetical protein JSR82_21125 [Verrucomicrobia bacterium]|nr:hypothetical protein [Verrucomicrobiota bacterium]
MQSSPAKLRLASALFALVSASAHAQLLVQEDFSSGTLPSSLEIVGPSVNFTGGLAVFPDPQFNGSGRTYLRTVSGAFANLGSYVAEITLIMPVGAPVLGTGFFGLGSGNRNPSFSFEPAGPSLNLRVNPDNIASGFTSFSDGQAFPGSSTPMGTAGSGIHQLRFSWDFLTRTALFEIDLNYTGGAFVPDLVSPVIDGADNGFDGVNAHLFFGGNAGTSFDNFSVRAVPEPGTVVAGMGALALGLRAAARRRRTAAVIAG